MVNIQNRNKDLTQIFDSRWKANHDYDAVKKMKQHDRDFTNKMFNVRENNVSNNNKVNYMEERLKRLQGNLDALKNNNRFRNN